MADNCYGLEPWVYQPSETAEGLADGFVHDNDIFTRALQVSFSYNGSSSTNTSTPNSSLPHTPTGPPPAVTCFPSDHMAQKRAALPVGPARKITKRKSRASKRSPTKFFTTDPANFREMVQQVTGIQVGSVEPNVIKPEPKRLMIPQNYCLPTTLLDTSAFMLDDELLPPLPPPPQTQQQQQQQEHLFASYSVDNNEFAGISSFDKDYLLSSSSSCFPTLESWDGIIM